jgi:hypothetical protein
MLIRKPLERPSHRRLWTLGRLLVIAEAIERMRRTLSLRERGVQGLSAERKRFGRLQADRRLTWSQ